MYDGRDMNTNSQTNSSTNIYRICTKHISNTNGGVIQNEIYCK